MPIAGGARDGCGDPGRAGLFGAAADIGRFGQAFLDEGSSASARILTAETIAAMTRNQIGGLGQRGLGWELDEPAYMGRLASPETFGHTRFTGTSIVIDPRRDVVIVMLPNRVPPTRTGPGVYAVRRTVASTIADAIDDT